jgi:protein-S-isoprenylcysteine O-methyltransferase Ste14
MRCDTARSASGGSVIATKAWAMIGSAIFLVIAPGFVAGIVPRWIGGWRMLTPFWGLGWLRGAGAALIALGSIGLLDSFRRFAVEGLGTPAPVFPTRHLVVTGLYRYVRNPMYVGVVSAVLGQGLLLGNAALMEYGAVVWVFFHLFVSLYEEPTLRQTFGAEYEAFCGAVPRWIPRLRPWRPE